MLVVLEVFLIEQADLLVEGVEFTFDDVFYDVGRLALDIFAFALDLPFAFEDVRWNVAAAHVEGVHRGDLEGQRTNEFLESGVVEGISFARTDLDENAEFGALVDVGGDLACARDLESFVAANGDVFTRFGDGFLAEGFEVGRRVFEDCFG